MTPTISCHYVGKHALIADRCLVTPSVIEEVVKLLKALKGGAGHLIGAFYVFGDDLISHNVYFTAQYAINLHDREPKCDIFI